MNAMVLCMLVPAISAAPPGPTVSAEQFTRLMKGAYGSVNNFSFICEGGLRFVGPAHLTKKPERLALDFQGAYAYRNDGRVSLDVYQKGLVNESSIVRKICTLGDGQYRDTVFVPERRGRRPSQTQQRPGYPGCFYENGSPERFLYLPFFNADRDLQKDGYQWLGWEEVDGHRCLKIQINDGYQKPGSESKFARFWFDLERGGHILRYERIWEGNTFVRLEDVVLQQFPTADNLKVWFPIEAKLHSFRWDDDYYQAPTFTENFHIVAGTLKINKGVGLNAFDIESIAGGQGSSGIPAMKDEFDRAGPPDRDLAGARERLERRLAQADMQAKQIDASSLAQEARGWSPVVQFALGSLGAFSLLAAALVKWRRR